MFESPNPDEAVEGANSVGLESVEQMLKELLNSNLGDNLFRLTAEVNRKTMNSLMEAGFSRDEAVRITAAQGGNLLG